LNGINIWPTTTAATEVASRQKEMANVITTYLSLSRFSEATAPRSLGFLPNVTYG
jgi:hypothetical protein